MLGSQEMCARASELTGIIVKRMLFNELDTASTYDGIWACASILHLPKPTRLRFKTSPRIHAIPSTGSDVRGMRNSFTNFETKESVYKI